MNITKDKFVKIHYTLKDENGEILDSSVETQPLAYLHGNGYLIPGLEKELEGKSAGEKFSVTVQPEDAYGIRDERFVAKIPKDRFDINIQIEVGMKFQAETPEGPAIVTVIDVQNDEITVDANHELAGKILNFDIEIIEVRDPTEEELAQLELAAHGGCGGGCGNCGGDCGGNCDGNCEGDCHCEEGGCNCGEDGCKNK